ncbi:hypothetical protein P170DRAFT_466207 [Aspergillus steynii IBT 23096]|uniref:C6 transcription factor n=1 Tax=Aspergillus steynii IBT 23096 TaxID=1392250 RepID=A0A2I2G1Q3_9EURO|nr:uncharacterized protein P170DRAFT_466207 [Aspergillus steynii IBT 23096]PLB46807.1 hypothetical protein P170DRAFT_466207 [Aspergillus steynii IBT 23096]
MVSTRHHPRDFPPPSTARASSPPSSPSASANGNGKKWVHTPSAAVTLWLLVSVPLVIWDAGYVLLRPHSMPGNKLHSPIWTPYALYGTIDYIYGWPAFNARNGFTAAQSVLNVLETIGYIYYLVTVYRHGSSATASGRASQRKTKKGLLWLFKDEKVLPGRTGANALLVAYSASVMTLGKTLLYWLNEFFSGFENIGHNDAVTLIFLWIIPNGLWIVFPAYNLHVLGEEIVSSLDGLAPRQRPGRPKSS